MAKFTASIPLNIKWHGNELVGASGATHRVPDALADEFEAAFGSLIPGFAWVTQDESTSIPVHAHAQSSIAGLTDDLAGKAALVHTHAQSAITGLTADLAGKFDKTGGIISGSVTVSGTLGAASIVGAAVTATSVAARGTPWYDVRAFGAAGDGSTDDASAVQSAVDAAIAAGGGVIFFPLGSYKIGSAVTLSAGGITLRGVGPGSVIVSPSSATSAIVTQAAASATLNHIAIESLYIKNGNPQSASHILVDLQFVDTQCVIRDTRIDGAGHGCMGIRLYNSWNVTLDRVYFTTFPSTGLPSLELRTTSGDGITGHPMNTIRVQNCHWQEVKYGVAIHNTADTNPGVVMSLVFINPRFKMTTYDENAIGIRALHDNILGVDVISPFFEDIGRPIVTKGYGWTILNPFVEHADKAIEVSSGGRVVVENAIFSSPSSNEIDICFSVSSAVVAPVELRHYRMAYGSTPTTAVIDNNAGLLGAPAALTPEAGAAHVTNANIAVANRAVYMPAILRQAARVTGIRIPIGASSGSVCAGLYDASGTRLATSGAISCPTGTTRASIPFTKAVDCPPGLYYLAFSCDNISATFGQSTNSGLVGTGLARFQASAHPLPENATFGGETSLQLAMTGIIDGSYIT